MQIQAVSAAQVKSASSRPLRSAPEALDRVSLGQPEPSRDWDSKLKALRQMVSKEESLSMEITPAKIERNRQVSQMFFDLGMELDELLNRQGPPAGANWAIWASHASERAGAFLRGESQVLGMKGPGRNFIHQANGIAMGDIGGPVSKFVETFRNDTQPDPSKREEFLKSLPDEALRQVFRSYYDAMWEQDPQKKQELVLLGNVAYGGREQARLDPFLNKAMQEMPGPNWLMGACLGVYAALTGAESAQAYLTDKLRMRWPGFEANLYQDVPQSKNPENLQQNRVRDFHSLENRELKTHLTMWRQSGGNPNADPNSMEGTGAKYWGSLPERMHFIAEMTREHLLDPNLYTPPSQYSHLKAG